MATVSIVIPTNRTLGELVPCLRAVASLRFDLSQVEVIAVFNGVSSVAGHAAGDWPFRFIHDSQKEPNICAAKNRAVDMACGEWVVLINDDTLVEPDYLTAHLRAHRELDRPGMVLGESVWKRYDDETVFDRMIAGTSMVFFYEQMAPHQWYNFRHAWNLNLSVRRRCFEAVRFDERLNPVNFDDLEWAYRMEERLGLQVWYAPEGRSVHDHRYTLDGYLKRELHLGRMAVRLWRCNPACYRAIFNADLNEDYLDYCRTFVDFEARREDELLSILRGIAARRMAYLAASVSAQEEWIRLLYHAHVPLKRLAFRRGVLEAAQDIDEEDLNSDARRLRVAAQRQRPR